MNFEVYKFPPRETVGGIPVFVEDDEYVRNYDQISGDHLQSISDNGINPFMDENYWQSIEKQTGFLLEKHLGQMLDRDLRILDVGVGTGRLLSDLCGCEKYGVDISLSYLELAQAKGIEVCKAKIEDLPYTDESMNIIVCTDVLEHVIDLHASISSLLKVLKADGVLILRVPYRERLNAYFSDTYPYSLAHIRSFCEFELLILFERVYNCKVVEWDLCGYTWQRPRLLDGSKTSRAFTKAILFFARKIMSKTLFQRFTEQICSPCEINMCIRKI